MQTKLSILLLPVIMLTACIGDPVYSIKHTMKFDKDLSEACITIAAKEMQGVTISKFQDTNEYRDFDEYIVRNNRAEIEVLWFHLDRSKLELSSFGIGYADKQRDANTCELLRTYRQSLYDACNIDPLRVSIDTEYVRSHCPDDASY